MTMSVPEAAARLGKSPQQVRKMVASRALRGQRVGGSWVIERQSVAEASSQTRVSGRPLALARAWGALDLLSEGKAPWLSPSARYQVREVLKSSRLANQAIWPSVFAAACSQREMSCHSGVLNALLKDPRVVQVGPNVASRHGLDLLAGHSPVGLLVGQEDFPPLCDDYLLHDARSADAVPVVVFVAAWDGAIGLLRPNQRIMRLAVAMSLLRSADPRARKAGQDAFAAAREHLLSAT